MDTPAYSFHLCLTQAEIEACSKDMNIILEGLGRNILEHLGNVELGKSVRLFLRDAAGRTVGGIAGDIFGGWLYISLLWVDEALRNRGFGSELLQRMEQEAVRLGCRHAHLDTYSFEARPFYERAGYEVFARLDEYPAGHAKYFLKKVFAGNIQSTMLSEISP
ncbi:MAG: GNAT family N-acetyltransferase [Acidobacteriaceae bacterium]